MLVYRYRKYDNQTDRDRLEELLRRPTQVWASHRDGLNDDKDLRYKFDRFVDTLSRCQRFYGHVVHIDGYINTIGVCSFSRTPINLHQWNRYAGSSTGVCLEYDIPRETVDGAEWILDVKYSGQVIITADEYVRALMSGMNVCDFYYMKETVFKILTSKESVWAPEDEVRLLTHVAPGRGLTKVIVGNEMSQHDIKRIRTLVPDGISVENQTLQ